MALTLSQAWSRTVRNRPDAPALIEAAEQRVWSRSELDGRAAAWHERYAGQVAGCTVAFAITNGAGWLEVFLGLLKSEGVAVPLDPGEPESARRAQARSISADFLWSDGSLEVVASPRRRRNDGRRLIKLTSGSTGAARAFAFTDTQMLADGRQICATMAIKPDDVNLGLIPFGHSYGLGNLVMPLLDQGTAVISGVPALPHALAAACARWHPTVFPAVPALLHALTQAEIPPRQLRSLRTVISAGAPLDPSVAREFHARFGLKIHSFYGSSETGGITYDRTGEATLTGRSVGQPLRKVQLTFRRGRRFLVESPAVFTLGNRKTNRKIGRHSPADFARLKEKGELTLLGRSNRLLKIGGRRLDPAEIEAALREVPGVKAAFVSVHPGRPDALAAIVAGKVRTETIQPALRQKLAPWKLPRKLIVVSAFPMKANGKCDTRGLLVLLRS